MSSRARRPRIGITADVKVTKRAELDITCNRYYYETIRMAGGEPVVIAPRADLSAVPDERERFDGLLFTGGDDLSGPFVPSHPESVTMHPLRQAWDLALLEAALGWTEMPLLCICLGTQELNVVQNGTLVPHLPDLGSDIEHRRFGEPDQWHPAVAEPGSRLAEIVGLDEFPVNSSHHQAVDQLGEGLRVAARAPDGTVEAIELAALSTRFVVAVQWHPERIISHPPHLALFEAFIDACAQRAEPAKELSHVR